MIRTISATFITLWLSAVGAAAQTCTNYPYNLTNGTTADANQVMANFNYVLGCAAVPALLRGWLGGLTLQNDGSSPFTVIDIAAGVANSDDATMMMSISTAITKNMNAAWAVGTGNGCLDTGSSLAANTWYHIFVIARTDTGVIDELCSMSMAPTLPASYTKKRRIGTIRTDGGPHILPFTQVGDTFLWYSMMGDVSVGAPGSSAVVRTLSTPPGVVTEALVMVGITNPSGVGQDAVLLSAVVTADVAIVNATQGTIGSSAGVGVNISAQARVLTNTSQQIRSRMVNGGAGSALVINTLGWRDFLGRFN